MDVGFPGHDDVLPEHRGCAADCGPSPTHPKYFVPISDPDITSDLDEDFGKDIVEE